MKIRTGIGKWLAITLVILTILAGSALRAQFSAGSYSSGDSGKIVPTATPKLSTDSTYAARAFPLYPTTLAPGHGIQEVNAYCNTCHSSRYITMQPPLPAATWATEVTKMEKTYGAQIPDDVSQKIVQYLQTHYTPETREP